MTDLNFETLDLVGILSGQDYPTHEVSVYFDEILGSTINTLHRKQRLAILTGDEEAVKTLTKELDALVLKTVEARHVVTLKQVPPEVTREVYKTVEKLYPTKFNFLGQAEPNAEANEEFIRQTWAVYMVRITDHTGAYKNVTDADVELIFNKAPESAQEAIQEGIKELKEGASSGFDYAAKQVDFLSSASPEG